MPRFLIEVQHEEEAVACARAAQVLLRTGSHFLTHAEFGCKDGGRPVPPQVEDGHRAGRQDASDRDSGSQVIQTGHRGRCL
jgi:hypothetical protein